MLFHCPNCGDVISVSAEELPYQGRCLACDEEVYLEEGRAVDADPNFTPEPTHEEVVREEPWQETYQADTVQEPASGDSSARPWTIFGVVLALFVPCFIGLIFLGKEDSSRSDYSYPPGYDYREIDSPGFEHLKLDEDKEVPNPDCTQCNGSGRAECLRCSLKHLVTCADCGVKRSDSNPRCRRHSQPCTLCGGRGTMKCMFCPQKKKRRGSGSRDPGDW